ncbi:MAG: Rne/Rng family ribonuclease [Candidatus Sumerlaeota bacterium]|nr:Rne/Rng family ribonuclease [Candidatus Sumerlaeota bacterium]
MINADDAEMRVAFLEDGKLVGLHIEPYSDKSVVGNLYKGRVEGIVPGLKAVFVNIGFEKNAFLHFSDLHSQYSVPHQGRPTRRGPEPAPNTSTLTIEPTAAAPKKRTRSSKPRPLEVGDEILVQVSKEEIGEKGHRVTTNISLPGRYLVYLPHSENEGGVSRRIEDTEERRRLRSILKDIKVPKGSFIVRTAGLEQKQEAITADVHRLQRQWRGIETKARRAKSPALIHNDHDLLFRLVRDSFSGEEDLVLVDDVSQARKLQKAIREMMPEADLKVSVYNEPQGIFEHYDVERQIQKALKNKVWLKSGGYVIIEETEAMTAIDVNTGKFVGRGDQEETSLRTNLEAAAEIVSQLRIREIGGIIVVDFIDMMARKNRETLLREVGRLLKQDRAKTAFSEVSEFGLIEITRKRVRESLSKTIFTRCPYCEGAGHVLRPSEVWKNIKAEIVREHERAPSLDSLTISVHPEIRKYLEDEVLEGVRRLANRTKVKLEFVSDESAHMQGFSIRPVEKKDEHKAKRPSRRRRGRGASRVKSASEGPREEAPSTPVEAPPAGNSEKTLETSRPAKDNTPTTSPE